MRQSPIRAISSTQELTEPTPFLEMAHYCPLRELLLYTTNCCIRVVVRSYSLHKIKDNVTSCSDCVLQHTAELENVFNAHQQPCSESDSIIVLISDRRAQSSSLCMFSCFKCPTNPLNIQQHFAVYVSNETSCIRTLPYKYIVVAASVYNKH